MGSDTEPVVEDVSADEAKAAMQRQATQQAQVKSIINSIDIEGSDFFHFRSWISFPGWSLDFVTGICPIKKSDKSAKTCKNSKST